MPYSSIEGKDWIKNGFLRIPGVAQVIDIGPGAGTYSDLLRSETGGNWVAVEKWAPYIREYRLDQKYDKVIVGDALYIDWYKVFDRRPLSGNGYRVAILGDVVEHLSREDGATLVQRVMTHADLAIVSLPVVHYPQGESHGNPYEAHEAHWAHEDFTSLFGDQIVAHFLGDVIGVYVLTWEDWENDGINDIVRMAFVGDES